MARRGLQVGMAAALLILATVFVRQKYEQPSVPVIYDDSGDGNNVEGRDAVADVSTMTKSLRWNVKRCEKTFEGQKMQWKSQGHEDVAVQKHYYKNTGCGGVFVEIGALDGSFLSNTWAYEHTFQWTGFLIEANPVNAEKLKINRPNVTTIWSAACDESKKEVKFAGSKAVGGVIESMSEGHKKGWKINTNQAVTVPCKPLGQLLKTDTAAPVAIDVFFLDVEGGEYEVLRTMDWSIPVGVFIIELDGSNKEKDDNVRKLLREHDYVTSDLRIRTFCTGDCPANEVFEHKDYKEYCEKEFS